MGILQLANTMRSMHAAMREHRDEQVEVVVRPSGGIVSAEDSFDIPNENATDCLNVFFRDGRLQTRYGYGQVGTQAAGGKDVLSLTEFIQLDGTEHYLRLVEDKAAKWDSVGGDWSDISGAFALNSSLTVPWFHDVMSDLFIFTNGSDDVMKWNGAGNIAELAGALGNYKAKIVRQFANHLMLFNTIEGGTAYPSRVRWSNAGAPETYTASDYDSVVSGDDWSPVVAAEAHGNQIIIFKEKSIFFGWPTGTTPQEYKFKPVIMSKGCVAGRTVQRVGNEIFFLAEDAVCAYGKSGQYEYRELSRAVHSLIFDDLNRTNVAKSFASVSDIDDLYLLFIPSATATEPDTVWSYNYKDETWGRTQYSKDMTCAGWWKRLSGLTVDEVPGTFGDHPETWGALGSAGEIYPVFGSTDGYVYNEERTRQDDSAGFDCRWESKDFRLFGVEQRGIYDRIIIEVKGAGEFFADYSVDGGVTWTNINSAVINGPFTRYVWHIGISATKLRIRFRTDSAADSFMDVREFTLVAWPGGRW